MWLQSILLLLYCYRLHAVGRSQSPPLIRIQPQINEIFFQQSKRSESNPIIFPCEADSEPKPNFRWIKNGKPFDWMKYDDRMAMQPGRGTLVITDPRDIDIGQYQCFASNEFGTATSNSIFLRKVELNAFNSETILNLSVSEGKPFQLPCQPPDGLPKPIVKWMVGSEMTNLQQPISDHRFTQDPDGNLWMSNVTRFDSSTFSNENHFYYVCTASSPINNEIKLGNRILLNVIEIEAPEINTNPITMQYVSQKFQDAIKGRKLELFCIFGGTPLPKVIWFKNGLPIRWSDRITAGNFGKSMIIDPVIWMDDGEYTCQIFNDIYQSVNYSMQVSILALPYFTVEPFRVTSVEEEDATFYCEAQGTPEPNIKWTFNGIPIDEVLVNERRVVTTNSITIHNLVSSDTGNYGCNATNNLGHVYRDVYLNVRAFPPEMIEEPGIKYINDRSNVRFVCRVFSAPISDIKWIKDGNILSSNRFMVGHDGSLKIIDATFSDSGNYQCQASNKLGSVTANGTLVIKRATYIADPPQDYEVSASGTATFRCYAVADNNLELKIEWLKNHETIYYTNPRFIQANDNSLMIHDVTKLDSGEYTCVAYTDIDRVEATAQLIVQDTPNPPEIVKIDCSERTATISWVPRGDNNPPILFFTIQFSISPIPNIWSVAAERISYLDRSYSVTIAPGGSYTFRIIATNKIGDSLPTESIQRCSTQRDVPYKNPDNVEGKGTRPNNLVISWTPMPEHEHNAPYFHYLVSWQKDLNNGNNKWFTQEINNWTQSSVEITGTPPFQRYRIKVAALNERGHANVLAREVIGYSGESEPLEAPGNFTVIKVFSDKSVLVGWNQVSSDSVNGHLKGYKIELWSETDPEQKMKISIAAKSNRALLNQLSLATYFAHVMVYNGRYNGPPSNTITFTTLEGRPGTIQTLETVQLGPYGVWLSWKPPLNPNGQLTGYKISYAKIRGFEIDSKHQQRFDDPLILSAIINGLEPNTKYRINVQAMTIAGDGENYYIEQTTQDISPSPIVPNIPNFVCEKVIDAIGFGAVKVQWRPTYPNPGSHFFVKYREQGELNWEVTDREINQDYMNIGHLNPNSTYEIRMVAVFGDHATESQSQFINMNKLKEPITVPRKTLWQLLPRIYSKSHIIVGSFIENSPAYVQRIYRHVNHI